MENHLPTNTKSTYVLTNNMSTMLTMYTFGRTADTNKTGMTFFFLF